MKKTTLKKAEKLLMERRTQIIEKIDKVVDIDIDGDETDEIQGKIIANIHQQISAREKQQLIHIDRALGKIKIGTFGLCEECEEEIGEKRLLAYPESHLCVSCAWALDIERSQHRR